MTAALLTLELATILACRRSVSPCPVVGRGTPASAGVRRRRHASPTTLWTLLAGVALGMGAYAGYGGAVVFSEETRGPRRGIARAVLGVLGVAVVAELLAIAAALLGFAFTGGRPLPRRPCPT